MIYSLIKLKFKAGLFQVECVLYLEMMCSKISLIKENGHISCFSCPFRPYEVPINFKSRQK